MLGDFGVGLHVQLYMTVCTVAGLQLSAEAMYVCICMYMYVLYTALVKHQFVMQMG